MSEGYMEKQSGKLLRVWSFVAAVPISLIIFCGAAYVAHWFLVLIVSNVNDGHDLIPEYAMMSSIASAILLITTGIRRRSKVTPRHPSSHR